MDRGTQEAGRLGRRVAVRGLNTPNWCAAGCGDLAEANCLYCPDHRQTRPEFIGPTDDNELDVSSHGIAERLADQTVTRGVAVCAHADCGQPCLAGRLYCSDRCRRRARKEPAQFTIEGVTATLREHATARGIDLTTVYARMRAGLGVIEAVLLPLDDLQRLRRTGSA